LIRTICAWCVSLPTFSRLTVVTPASTVAGPVYEKSCAWRASVDPPAAALADGDAPVDSAGLSEAAELAAADGLTAALGGVVDAAGDPAQAAASNSTPATATVGRMVTGRDRAIGTSLVRIGRRW
jgi:hypothetical protein